MNRIHDKFTYAYHRCGYFNLAETPSIGGPKVNGKMVDKSLYRFATEIENFDDVFDIFEADMQATDNWINDKIDDVFAPEADQFKALTHLRVGYFKWIHRYLGECNSEANQSKHSYRFEEISYKLKKIFEDLTVAQAPKH